MDEGFLSEKITDKKGKGICRELTFQLPGMIDFASNDYLGFLHDGILDALMKEKVIEAKRWGAGGSRLLTGNSTYCEELEKEIARFHQAEAGLLFNSGYTANLGLISSIAAACDTIIYDQEVHASVHDGIRISRADAFPFRHLDPDHLRQRLKQAKGLVFGIESVYSCNGRQAPLIEIHRLCQEAGAHLIIDEAHATGWLGQKGEGAVQMLGLQEHIFARISHLQQGFGRTRGDHFRKFAAAKILDQFCATFHLYNSTSTV